MRSVKLAQKSFLLNVPCGILSSVLLTLLGLILYSYFYILKCDPYEGGIVTNPNQLILIFMLHILQDLPGLAGLYMATIFSGALSTLSSGINSLAANTTEDILSGCLRGVSEKTVTIFAKIIVFMYGFAILGVTYLARSLEGPVTQLASSVFGACGSAVLGMFVLGCTVPWANKYGAFAGGLLSLAMNMWIVIGSRLYGKKNKPLPPLTTEQCSSLFLDSPEFINVTYHLSPASNLTTPYTTDLAVTSSNIHDPYDYTFFLYDVSYTWYGLIGTIACMVIGLVVSKLTNGKSKAKTDAKLIIPQLRKFWGLEELPTTEVEINGIMSK